MSEFPLIDGPTALRLLHEVVEPDPGFVYSRPGRGDACLYVWEDQPSCLIAQVLARVGWSVADLARLDADGLSAGELADDPGWNVSGSAVEILAEAQHLQDIECTWGEALAAAERLAVTT